MSINQGQELFKDYYAQWVKVYKEGAIREVTMDKYRLTQSWLDRIASDLRLEPRDVSEAHQRLR